MPFYQYKTENIEAQTSNSYDIKYYDRPSSVRKSNYIFRAETSLMEGNRENMISTSKWGIPNFNVNLHTSYKSIMTLQWGFSVKNGTMTILPVKIIQPSHYHQSVLNTVR